MIICPISLNPPWPILFKRYTLGSMSSPPEVGIPNIFISLFPYNKYPVTLFTCDPMCDHHTNHIIICLVLQLLCLLPHSEAHHYFPQPANPIPTPVYRTHREQYRYPVPPTVSCPFEIPSSPRWDDQYNERSRQSQSTLFQSVSLFLMPL